MTSSVTKERDDGLEIYRRLSNAWQMAGIDREVSYRELVLAPIFDGFAPVGAAIYLSVLCYPEDQAKRSRFVDAISARMFKTGTKPRSAERKELRATPGISSLLDMPNKRIEQILNDGLRQFHSRMRAGWVLGQKLTSSGDPNTQLPLKDLMLKAARQNTRHYPAFYSSADEEEEEQIITSFRQRVMSPARPVAHLALELHSLFTKQQTTNIGLLELVNSAEGWLARTIENAEIHRVMFGDIFPSHESTYLPGRAKNYYVPPEEMIAVLPYIDPITPQTGWDTLKNLERLYQPPAQN
ncbi:hypothetical protein [Thiohalophilus sp.]|uniref:hypothetical protein n=1 Tax=Thiohalophilus sp. TaxID=3028392 RepID=UPI002ACD8DDA|nr:hypothetical protein [Thiohalophilus sp.]MDZ7662514.1 hypothetical protein [Thiohalophilus sp.]